MADKTEEVHTVEQRGNPMTGVVVALVLILIVVIALAAYFLGGKNFDDADSRLTPSPSPVNNVNTLPSPTNEPEKDAPTPIIIEKEVVVTSAPTNTPAP